MKNILFFLFFLSSCTTLRYGNLIYEHEFNDLDEWVVKEEFYNDMDNYFSPDVVSVDGILRIRSVEESVWRECWRRHAYSDYTVGMVVSKPVIGYGTWVIRARVPNNFSAIWLLKQEYGEHNFITPEIDIMEVIRGRFQHTVHYDQEVGGYTTKGCHRRGLKWDYEWHEFAVKVTKDGYEFYTDNKLTGRLSCGTSWRRNFLLLNSGVREGDKDLRDFEVDWVRVYKNE